MASRGGAATAASAAATPAPGPPPDVAMYGPTESSVSLGTKYRTVMEEIQTHRAFGSMTLTILSPWLLFVLAYYAFNVLAVGLIIIIFLMVLGHLHHTNGNLPASVLTCGMIGACAVGLRCYYGSVLPIHLLHLQREVENAYANEPASALDHASVVRFTTSSTVDDSMAFGMKILDSGLDTFCVAPIMDNSSGSSPAGSPAEFWAVGINCCGNRGDFRCDEGGESAAGGGEIVPAPRDILYSVVGKYFVPSEARHDLFMRAVRAASAVYGVPAGKEPVLVRLDKRSRGEMIVSHWLQLAIVAAILFPIAAAAAAVLAYLLKVRSMGSVASEALRGTSDFAAERYVRFRLNVNSGVAALAPSQLETHILGFAVPLTVLLACVLLFSWAPCWKLGGVILGALISFVFTLVTTLMMVKRNFAFGVIILLSAVFGSLTGHWNYLNYAYHSCSVSTYNDYSDVAPDANGLNYADASQVYFGTGTFLGVGQSVGVMHEGDLYCAAPVFPSSCASAVSAAATTTVVAAGATTTVAAARATTAAPAGGATTAAPAGSAFLAVFAEDDPSAAATAGGDSGDATAALGGTPTAIPGAPVCTGLKHVDFWAVGYGCCQPKGGFNCFAAGQLTGQAGLVVRESREKDGVGLFEDLSVQGFRLAARAAADLHDLPSTGDPILMRWGRNPQELQREWTDGAAKIIVLTTAIAFFVLALAANGGLALLSGTSPMEKVKRAQATSGPMGSPGGGASAAMGVAPRGTPNAAAGDPFVLPPTASRPAQSPPAPHANRVPNLSPTAAAAAEPEPPSPVLPRPQSRRRRD